MQAAIEMATPPNPPAVDSPRSLMYDADDLGDEVDVSHFHEDGPGGSRFDENIVYCPQYRAYLVHTRVHDGFDASRTADVLCAAAAGRTTHDSDVPSTDAFLAQSLAGASVDLVFRIAAVRRHQEALRMAESM